MRAHFLNEGDALGGLEVVKFFSYRVNGKGFYVFQMYVGDVIYASGFRFLRAERMVLISSGEMDGSKWVLSTFNLWITYLLSLFWVWDGR